MLQVLNQIIIGITSGGTMYTSGHIIHEWLLPFTELKDILQDLYIQLKHVNLILMFSVGIDQMECPGLSGCH